MSDITPTTHVAQLVLDDPSRARVFERLGIDYCCGGRTPLAEACRTLDLDVARVIAALDEPRQAGAEDADWTATETPELIDHILTAHHGYLREELEPLGALVRKVARAHGDAHPELHEVEATFTAVAADLAQHLPQEELVVFPACVALARGEHAQTPLGAPIEAMLHDHDQVAAGLRRLRRLTGDYAVPGDACNSYRAMLDRLETLEADTHHHVHEENNVLFPRALALAAGA